MPPKKPAKKRRTVSTSAERMRLQAERDAQHGVQRICVRVPAERADELRELARKWLARHQRERRQNLPGQGRLEL